MSSVIDDLSNYGSLMILLVGFGLIFASGIFFSIVYFGMDTVQTQLATVDCVIPDNGLASTCQELFNLSIYPLLGLKSILVWFSYFFIFALVIGMLITGYRSGKSPALMGLLITFVVCTYVTLASIEYPNSTIIYPDINMTQNGQAYNYTFAPDLIGTYYFLPDYYSQKNY